MLVCYISMLAQHDGLYVSTAWWVLFGVHFSFFYGLNICSSIVSFFIEFAQKEIFNVLLPRGVMSHDTERVMQNLKKNPFVSKMIRIWWILIQALNSPKFALWFVPFVQRKVVVEIHLCEFLQPALISNKLSHSSQWLKAQIRKETSQKFLFKIFCFNSSITRKIKDL